MHQAHDAMAGALVETDRLSEALPHAMASFGALCALYSAGDVALGFEAVKLAELCASLGDL